MHVLCVVWELMRQRFFAVFQLVGWRVLAKCVCVLVCFVVWHAVGCLEQHGCCSIKSPLNLSRTFLLVVAHEFCFGSHVVGCCLWGGVLCENCIVDANAIKKQQ